MPIKSCNHVPPLEQPASSAGCGECLALGDGWVHLRLCVHCGHVGCCDSSKNKHAMRHFASTSDLSLTRMADEVGLSTHHFARVFKATFGTPPHRYVQHRRLEAAAAALQREAQRPIADIALEHGFASQAHMTDLMRRHLGRTPRELRRRG